MTGPRDPALLSIDTLASEKPLLLSSTLDFLGQPRWDRGAILTFARVIEADFTALTSSKDEGIDPDILRVDSDTFGSGDNFVVASPPNSSRGRLSMRGV